MKLASAKSGGGDFTPAPAGNHRAVCTRFIDLGTHKEVNLKGQEVMRRNVVIGWELCDELIETEDGEKPQVVTEFYTWSTHEKANLRKMLESWRGKKFTEKELETFDVKNLLGVSCMVNVSHKEKKAGGTRAVVANVSPLPKGMEKGQPAGDILYVALEPDLFDVEAFDTLSDWFKEKIRSSPEFAAMNEAREEKKAGKKAAPEPDFIEDEVPF